jgi:hypothetical protein
VLNDLYDIERGLKAHGAAIVAQHPDVKDMAKGGAILVRLDARGGVDDIEFVPDSGNGALWTLRDGQHNGFPGLKTGQPGNPKSAKPGKGLLTLDGPALAAHEKIWADDRTPAARRREALRLIAEADLDAEAAAAWPNAGHRKRIAERLAQLGSLRGDRKTAAVPAAFERFLLALERQPPFLADLLHWLKGKLQSGGDDWIEPARNALIGPAAIYVDVAEDDFPRPVRDLRQVAAVSAALAASSASPDGEGSGTCALTGAATHLHAGNFPQPNLPGLGQTYLFSRNSDIPSLTRYGKTADDSFAIGGDLLGRLSGAISFLTRPAERDKIWRLIPAESGDKPDLMIAFCPAAPDIALAGRIAADDEAEPLSFAEFEEKARQVVAQSHGAHEQAAARTDVTLLVLRAVDPANRKAIYHRAVSAARFFEAAKDWRLRATDNAPPWMGFRMPQSRKVKGAPIVVRHPPRVPPLSLTPLSRTIFAEGGRRGIEAIGLPASVAFVLFLQDGDAPALARRALALLLERHGPLLAGLAQAARKGGDALKSFDPKFDLRADALQSVSWFGALLQRLGRDREVYMSETAFRLGQFLAAVDTVHVGYCADMRGGDVPPTLLGNSVLSIAGAHPERAVAIVMGRWKPYGGWANQERRIRAKAAQLQDGKDGQLAWDMRRGLSAARRIQPFAADLARDLESRKAPDDVFKAQLLLGYVAGLPPLPKKDAGEPQDDGHIEINEGEEQ